MLEVANYILVRDFSSLFSLLCVSEDTIDLTVQPFLLRSRGSHFLNRSLNFLCASPVKCLIHCLAEDIPPCTCLLVGNKRRVAACFTTSSHHKGLFDIITSKDVVINQEGDRFRSILYPYLLSAIPARTHIICS